MAIKIQIIGKDELAQAFRAVGERSNQIITEKLNRAAHSIADRLASAYSAASGGRTVHRIYVKTGTTKRGNPYASIVVGVGLDRLELDLEFGTSKTPAYHWIRSTFLSAETRAALEKELMEGIEQIIKEASVT